MIAVAVPRRRTGRWFAAAAVALASVAIFEAPRTRKVTLEPDAPGFRYIPLAGSPVADAVDRADGEIDWDRGGWVPPAVRPPGGCAELLDELVQHPHWQLQVAERSSSCEGIEDRRRLTIDADGLVTWHERDLPERHAMLTADELAEVRALNRLDCVRTEPTGYGELFYELAWGADTEEGAHIAHDTAMGNRLAEVLDAAFDRYAALRLAAVGPLRIDLAARSEERSDRWSRRAAIYRLTLDADGALTVRRGRRVLVTSQLDARARADLIDAILAGAVPPAPEAAIARGVATIGGRAIPLVVDDFGEVGALEPLTRAIDDATSE